MGGPTQQRLARHAGKAWSATTNKDGLRDRILRRALFDAAGKVAPAIVATDGEVQFLVDTNDSVIGRQTFAAGNFELDVMRSALTIVGREIGRDPLAGKVFVDVGANIGTTSVPAGKLMGASRVIAIEPAPHNFRLLRCNVILNELDRTVTCVQAAVTRVRGTVELELSKTNIGDHRVRVGNAVGGELGEENRRIVKVDGLPLDAILNDAGVAPSEVGLLWIDTQGHEGHVLASASTLLAAGVPAIVEYWPYGLVRGGGADLLHTEIAKNFRTVVDVRSGERIAAEDVSKLESLYPGNNDYTDLALIP